MRAQRIILMLLFFVTGWKISAQPPSQSQNYIPKILPPSPEAASLAKYGNYEVNMYSGLPGISIPLYDIQVGELRVPISLSYHAAGIKVSDLSSWVGLGWSLSAGGSINRKVMGRPDELPGGYLTGSNPVRQESSINQLSATDLDYLKNIVTGYYDVEPDIYSYSMPGKGGKFLFNQPNSYTPIIMPYDPIKITRTQTGSTTQKFSITDENGIQYKFDTYEWTLSGSGGLVNNDAASTWLLTNMISANKQDTIVFMYTARSGTGTTDYYINETFVINDNATNSVNPPVYSGDLGNTYLSTTYTTTTWQINNEIRFKNGKVVFEQSTEGRQDLASGVDAPKRLNAIKVYSYDNTNYTYKLIRTIRFYHGYFVSSIDQSKRLRLDSLAILNTAETEGQKYRFDYNTAQSLPQRLSLAKDYWGYFNNAANNSLIPRMQIPYVDNVGITTSMWIGSNVLNGREPDPNYMQAYVLNKITFPTGGYTTFEYETNQYLDAQSISHYAGGLRVKKIKSYDGISSSPVTKTYKYGTNESGYGRTNFIINNYFFQNEQTNWYWQSPGSGNSPTVVATKRVRTYFSNPTIDIEPFDGSPVSYPGVTEYTGDETTNMGKTIYQFNDHADGMNVVAGYGKPLITTYHFNRGQLTQKDVYKYNPGNTYTKVSTTLNSYEAFPEQWNSYQGLAVFKWRANEGNYGEYCDPQCCGNTGCYDSYAYRLANYSIRTGDNKLTQTTETTYDPADESRSVTTVTNYYFDNFNHQQPTRIQTTNSEGQTDLTTKKYPHDYSSLQPYSDMVAANIINKVVDDIKTTNGNATTFLKNNYYNWSNNNFLPQTVQFQKGSNTIETRANFLKYDIRGNPQEMQKTNDIKQAYIWNYQSIYPVAEVMNASESDIAFTSFEADGKGNWNYTGLQFTDGSAPTGIKVYHLATGSITKNAGSAGTYIVSYWSKNGAQNVNSTASSSGRTLNGWTYFEHKLTLAANGLVTVSGTGIIDELRLYPEKALMTTMTYQPLVGMTSQCDANNRITYYEYDEFNRLILIRDQDKNIIKKVCYNYSGQTENCNIYYNTIQQMTFTKQCPSGYTGSQVTYVIPAGTYLSSIGQTEANQKAIDDLLANGQAYANALGTCTQQSSCTPSNCTGEGYKCVYGVCELGVKVYTYIEQIDQHLWTCTYHYEWSDGSWSEDYYEESPYPCGN